MTDITIIGLDLNTSAVLQRAAQHIDEWGHIKGDFVNHEDGGYCAAGAIANASGIEADDWHEQNSAPCFEGEDLDEHARWLAGRAASLAALRAFSAHLFPNSRPEDMTREALIVKIGDWNDADDRTAEQVIEEMRAAAQEATP
ncbi:hypothetical protein ACIBG4_40480 [Nonomuraea sp. NPDC050383]|uniref:DUF6197 family protein n=1 Tax=Nonomuraea sp. NPDC050383 TaxID=3364362 RepID=UPI0037934AF5